MLVIVTIIFMQLAVSCQGFAAGPERLAVVMRREPDAHDVASETDGGSSMTPMGEVINKSHQVGTEPANADAMMEIYANSELNYVLSKATKCCWNRVIQPCTENSDCDSGGEGCIVSGTHTQLYGLSNCNTCEMQGQVYNRATYKCEATPQACPSGYDSARSAGKCPGNGLCCGTGWTADCDMLCAKSSCLASGGNWISLDFNSNPYTCEIPQAATPDDNNEECEEPECAECSTPNQCTRCSVGRMLSAKLSCVPFCPPGEYEDISGSGVCSTCDGEVTRTNEVSTCGACPNGHINYEGHDQCQNIQDMCSPAQCHKCEACLEKASPKVKQCLEQHGQQRDCVNFDEVWCHKFWGTLFDCEGYSVGCFFKLMCHNPCVCPEWKTVRCGGDTSGSPTECSATMLQALLEGNASQRSAPALISRNESADEVSEEAASLDQSLSGKRTCR